MVIAGVSLLNLNGRQPERRQKSVVKISVGGREEGSVCVFPDEVIIPAWHISGTRRAYRGEDSECPGRCGEPTAMVWRRQKCTAPHETRKARGFIFDKHIESAEHIPRHDENSCAARKARDAFMRRRGARFRVLKPAGYDGQNDEHHGNTLPARWRMISSRRTAEQKSA